MPLVDDPDKPLRDVRLDGMLLTLARVMGGLRMLTGSLMAVTYFQTWQLIAGVPVTGYEMAGGSPFPVLCAAGIVGLGYYLIRVPSLSRGMLSAAGSIVLALIIAALTRNKTTAALETVQLKPAQIAFGFSFIVLTFTGFGDLIFHPILYMWQRRNEQAQRR